MEALADTTHEQRIETKAQTGVLLALAESLLERLAACRATHAEEAKREERRKRRAGREVNLALIVDPLDWLFDLTYAPASTMKDGEEKQSLLHSLYGYW